MRSSALRRPGLDSIAAEPSAGIVASSAAAKTQHVTHARVCVTWETNMSTEEETADVRAGVGEIILHSPKQQIHKIINGIECASALSGTLVGSALAVHFARLYSN